MSEGENKFLKLAQNILQKEKKKFARQIVMKQMAEEGIIMGKAGDRQQPPPAPRPQLTASASGETQSLFVTIPSTRQCALSINMQTHTQHILASCGSH